MPTFRVRYSEDGGEHEALLEADDRAAARQLLKDNGMGPLQITEEPDPAEPPPTLVLESAAEPEQPVVHNAGTVADNDTQQPTGNEGGQSGEGQEQQ